MNISAGAIAAIGCAGCAVIAAANGHLVWAAAFLGAIVLVTILFGDE